MPHDEGLQKQQQPSSVIIFTVYYVRIRARLCGKPAGRRAALVPCDSFFFFFLSFFLRTHTCSSWAAMFDFSPHCRRCPPPDHRTRDISINLVSLPPSSLRSAVTFLACVSSVGGGQQQTEHKPQGSTCGAQNKKKKPCRPSLWLRRLIPVMSGAGEGFRTRRRVLVLLSLVFVFASMACDCRVMSMEGGCGWTVFVPHP